MCSDKLKMYSYKTIYQSMKIFRSNDLQSTMFITETVHLVIYETRILFMTAFIIITQQLLLLLARDKICRAHYAIARPSVHPFICQKGG